MLKSIQKKHNSPADTSTKSNILSGSMCDFADHEDRKLVRLAKVYEDDNQPIDWSNVAKSMRRQKKSKLQLRERLKTLRRTHGKRLCDFPRWFFVAPSKISRASRPQEPAQLTDDPSLFGKSILSSFATMLLKVRQEKNEKLPRSTVHDAVASIVSSFAIQGLRDASQAEDYNIQDVTPMSVSTMIDVLGDITRDDVFVDIGSATGSIVAQIALETRVRRSIGVEVLDDIADISMRLLQSKSIKWRPLSKVSFQQADVRCHDFFRDLDLSTPTILYASNELLPAEGNRTLEAWICEVKVMRYVILGLPFCAQHNAYCENKFCGLYELVKVIDVFINFRLDIKNVFIYKRKLP